MKHLTEKLWCKCAAFFLAMLTLLLTAASGFAVGVLVTEDVYVDGGIALRREAMTARIYDNLFATVDAYQCMIDYEDGLPEDFYDPAYSNFRYRLTDSTGKLLWTNMQAGEDLDYRVKETYYGDADQIRLIGEAGVTKALTAMDEFRRLDFWLTKLIALRSWWIPIAVLSLLITAALLIFLLCAAGHKEGTDGIYRTWLDRMPFDLLTVLVVAGIALAFCIPNACGWDVLSIAGALVLSAWLLLIFLYSFVVRCKAGGLFSNTLLYRLGRLLWRCCRTVYHTLLRPLGHIGEAWKLPLAFAVISGLELALGLLHDADVLWLFEHILLFLLLVGFGFAFRSIERAGRHLAAGELRYQVNTAGILPPLRAHAEDLNRIGEGMEKAVSAQMKSERMKTELITNVSHDIKTPLTSIVNYAELLKGCELSDETAKEYVEVISRQSLRLKKLTEDLVEASKASTGNISVELSSMDGAVLLAQTAGEWEEKLSAAGLELLLQPLPPEANITADGRLLWRVFDNLMSNIIKYALPGTRVYLACEVGESVDFSFKNISRYPLNISPDELTERFVRADASRSTEGSGLGLSIAKSLTELQGGTFSLHIDGDLFRADVSFPKNQ